MERLPGGYEAALRFVARQHAAACSAGAREFASEALQAGYKVANACWTALDYCLAWLMHLRSQHALQLAGGSCELLLAGLAALSSTAYKFAAARARQLRGARQQQPVGMEQSLEERLLSIMSRCGELAWRLVEFDPQPTGRSHRLVAWPAPARRPCMHVNPLQHTTRRAGTSTALQQSVPSLAGRRRHQPDACAAGFGVSITGPRALPQRHLCMRAG